MENELIKLQPFDESDFHQLIVEIPDARFLLQWAGPKYTFPLDASQLSDTLVKTIGEEPSLLVFKGIKSDTSETVGHIQLMNIDYNSGTCVLGRVLIFQKFRNNGFGKAMVRAAIIVAFEEMNLAEVTLKVFDFNTTAISLYKSIGFCDFQFERGTRQFQDENLNAITMKLYKDSWLQKKMRTTQCR
jgi:RimJ/RimL family protein N-acetyltransferase